MSLICCHYSLFRACLSLAVSLSLFVLAPLLYLFLPHLRIFATVLVLCAFVFPISIYILPLVYIFFLLFVSLSLIMLSLFLLSLLSLLALIYLLSRFALFVISLLSMISLLSLSLSLSLSLVSFPFGRTGPDGKCYLGWAGQSGRTTQTRGCRNTARCAVLWRRRRARTQHSVLCSGGGGGPEHSTVSCVLAAGAGQNTAQCAVFRSPAGRKFSLDRKHYCMTQSTMLYCIILYYTIAGGLWGAYLMKVVHF